MKIQIGELIFSMKAGAKAHFRAMLDRCTMTALAAGRRLILQANGEGDAA